MATAMGVGLLEASIAEISKADMLLPPQNVILHPNPRLNNVNLGTPVNGAKPLLPISQFAAKYATKLFGVGVVLSTTMAIDGMRKSKTQNERISYLVKGAFDVSVAAITFGLGASPIGVGLAATYFTLDYLFKFREMIHENLDYTNRVRTRSRKPSRRKTSG